ncbi:MAG: LacI family DNA-binding transcriptional regulator [Anaerolineaceae bacterium]|nr:LacI family DNA-binding transcriptional regulator [Anaerolineaceae bacterium]
MDERVTISNIAQKTGVSLSTVSLVLNNKPGVADITRAKVIDTAEQLGYPIKQSAINLRGNVLSTLGMIVKTDFDQGPSENPFYSRIIMGIEDSCRRNGISLLFATLPVDDQNHPVETPALLYNDSVDGVLMVGTFVDETVFSVSGKRTPPIVLVDAYSNTDSFDTVISDNFRAAYQEVEYLMSKGHRHIGLVGAEPNAYPSLRDRRNGYFRALKENDVPDTYVANFNINKTKGYAEVSALLKENPGITAIFCINDEVAVTAMRAAQDLGLKIPHDLSVVGYDDINLAKNAAPALTTMRVDTTAMGRAAVHLLSLRLDNPDIARMTLTVNPTLIERASVSDYKT